MIEVNFTIDHMGDDISTTVLVDVLPAHKTVGYKSIHGVESTQSQLGFNS